jgi:hypothetical protein
MSTNTSTAYDSWSVSGSYYEVCSCEAICPCRHSRGEKGGRPTYDPCDFALSWWIKDGHAGATDLRDLKVVMVGRWDVKPGNPWHVILYVDDRATAAQKDALTAVFLGRAGGLPGRGYGSNIVEVHEVRSATITLDHTPAKESIDVAPFLTVKTREAVKHDFSVTCGIPGHDHPGQEIRAEVFRYEAPPYAWELHGRCGFYTQFAYSSSAPAS